MKSSRPKLLFYCQHLLGLGHLTRSLATCRELVRYFDVDFVQGGPDEGKSLSHPNFRHIFLKPLLMREADSTLYDPSGKLAPEELVLLRASQIEEQLRSQSYDFVVTELFPFGRKKIKKEILRLIELAKAANPKVGVYCGLRDILVTKHDADRRDRDIANIVNDYYDGVLVHSDEKVLKLEETYSQVPSIADKIHYTGFITETHPPLRTEPRRPEVLVSMGGGVVGSEMLLAVAEATSLLPELHFRFLIGPYAPADLRGKLEAIRDRQTGSVTIEGLSKNFEEELLGVALSISLAGYNTLMNILNTKTMALVYPYRGNQEQILRARRLESAQAVKMIGPEDLAPERIATIIRETAFQRPARLDVNLDGAINTAEFLWQKWTADSSSPEA